MDTLDITSLLQRACRSHIQKLQSYTARVNGLGPIHSSGTGWGPFQVTRYTEDDELVKQQLPAPDISPWTERHGTHADFRKNMHFEEPPSSDSEEDEEKAIKDWKKLFEEDHASASITAPGPPPDRH